MFHFFLGKLGKKFCFILFFLFLIGFWYFVWGIHRDIPSRNQKENALWIGHTYAQEPKTLEEIETLVSILSKHHIRYVYVHVGPLEPFGTLDPQRYRTSYDFLKTAQTLAPEIQFQAWLGQIRSKLRLESKDVRSNIVDLSLKLVREVGFSGIHLDIEPIFDGDKAFLELMSSLSKRLPKSALLSVASDEWQSKTLTPFVSFLIGKKSRSFWGTKYFQQVSEFADHIVVMTYDSSLPYSWLYSFWVEQQIIYITNALKNTNAKVLIGLPTYKNRTKSFAPEAENLSSGITGVIRGLENIRSHRDAFSGIALYPYWTMDETDWHTLDTLWP